MPRPKPETHEEATLRMFNDEDSWPNWPVLPVKRWNAAQSTYDCGLIYAGQNTVRLENIYGRDPKDTTPVKCLDYSSRQAMIDDGWKVD